MPGGVDHEWGKLREVVIGICPAEDVVVFHEDSQRWLAPDGAELGRILVAEPVANCTFGGPDGRTLFITATSTVWSIEVGIRGAVTPWVEREA